MTKVVRRPPGKERPGRVPVAGLRVRRAAARSRCTAQSFRHGLTLRREVRRERTRPAKWRRWGSYTSFARALSVAAGLLVLAWCAEGLYGVFHGTTAFEKWVTRTTGLEAILRFVGPVLTAGAAATIFLFVWYGYTKHRYLARARRSPRTLVPTAGPNTGQVVGRQEIAQVIAERLRDRATRRPYLLVGGVGTGKTAVMVQLTELLARQGAVPVPVRLRDAAGQADLNFEEMAKRRFAEEAPQGILARSKNDKVWQQLLADDKPVVIADGLEEALLDEQLQDDRDNIIRRAIDRAYEEKLPLVIASRPHSPLEGTRAAIIELEPLSEEAALHFVEAQAPEADERRLDWIVETAEVTESPLYLQIARELHDHGVLERDRPQTDRRRLDTRSWDRSTLRLWLLETWEQALAEGRLRQEVVLSPQDRRDTIEVVSALACVGLLQDKLEVGFTDLLGEQVRPTPVHRAGAEAERLWKRVRNFDPTGRRGNALSEWQREQIWSSLCGRVSSEERRSLLGGTVSQRQAALARCVANADALRLVEGFEKKVRFPHSILQVYFGFRALHELGEDRANELVDQALQPPGPGRELLIALVLLSRRCAAEAVAPEAGVTAAVKKDLRQRYRRLMLNGRPLAPRLCRAAGRRADPKALDIYAAALEIESVAERPEHLDEITGTLVGRWHDIKGDARTLDEAKLGCVKQLGAALRTAAGRTDTTPLYTKLFKLGITETSYSIRMAVSQEFGNGGDPAFAMIRPWIHDINRDPMEEYIRRIEAADEVQRRRFDAWAAEMQKAAGTEGSSRAAHEEHVARLYRARHVIVQEHRQQRVDVWREFVMRAWALPMLLGSVSDGLRDEARSRLMLWLRHLDPKYTDGRPDLPLSLENALAQGFKYAANRRKRHPFTYPGGRADLIRQAETMLRQTRCWYAQLCLLHALCLWELPDTAARHKGLDGQGRQRAEGSAEWTAGWGAEGNGLWKSGETRPATAVQSVERWLSMAGTNHTVTAHAAVDGRAPRQPLHPFVAEAGDLAALALESGRPERFMWIDEKGVADTIGSRSSGRQRYRKHNLWIPPSTGWVALDARAQRLVAEVLVLLNLIERDGHPDEVEDRLAASSRPGTGLPPCMTTDRTPLHPELTAGSSGPPAPGTTCLPSCVFQFCPYPPRGTRPRSEIREPFCRQQQVLLRRRVRRRTPDWAGMRAPELHGFWEAMAHRLRG
ncbi:ATP-binding protein [Streptomyces griseocarneus]|uniref:ATP-binding protein n=1 Tax=Streptomyces griseocarneus TaxID=51201 RepID=UPI00167CF56F|nr:ATP-binding protein [Streptomyces griseocarneus]MBZ6476411.1 ATP-binding protein [Streptomyces griseocarneus]GHG79086.1 hypothetical protein GCM10018779_59660 [Streptomyces griseocarneus]